MKKLRICLLSFLVILVGCSIQKGESVKAANDALLNANELTVIETLNVKQPEAELYKASFYTRTISVFQERLLSYTEIYEQLEGEMIGELYIDDVKTTRIYEGEVKKQTIDKQTSLANHYGLDKLLTKASTLKTETNVVEGFIRDSDIIELIKNILSYANSDIQVGNLITFSSLNYSILYSEDLSELKRIDLNLTNIALSLYPNITDAIYSLEFLYEVNEDIPVYQDINDDPDLAAIELAKTYLTRTYSATKTLKTDLKLETYFVSNPNDIAFAYRSSNTSVLSNTGKFKEPATETNVTLEVDLIYKGKVNQTLSFDYFVPVAQAGTGELLSATNPLFQYDDFGTELNLFYIDMIQQYGDSIYIKSGDFDMLIDAGDTSDGGTVKKVLQDNVTDQVLELLVVTHAHSDHYGGLSTAVSGIGRIEMILDYGYNRTDITGPQNYQNWIRQSATSKYCAVSDAVKNINGCSKKIYLTPELYIDVLNTGQYLTPTTEVKKSDGNNEASVTFMLIYKSTNFYFSGDLDASGESKVISNENISKYKVNIMKATHHGTNDGNTANLLNAIKPTYVVITTALGNVNQHPFQAPLTRFKNAGAKMYCTFTSGTIKFTSNGSTVGAPECFGPTKIAANIIPSEANLEFTQTTWYKKNRS